MMDEKLFYIYVAFFGNLSILLLFFLNFIKKFKYKYFLSCMLLFNLAFIISLRDKDVALDTSQYVFLFQSGDYNIFFNEHVYDTGYIILNLFINLFTSNYNIFLFLMSFMHILIIFYFYKNFSKKYFPIFMMMYISTFTFWLSNLSMLRQGLAIPIFAIAIYYLIFKEKKIKFLIFSCIAGSIHYTAFFLSLFYFFIYFIYKKIPTYFLKLLLIIEIILVIYPKNLFIDIIMNILKLLPSNNSTINKILWYFNWNKLEIWHVKHVYFLVLIMFFVIILLERNKKFMLLISLPVSLLAFLKYDEMVTDRLFMYFVPYIPLVLFELMQIIQKKYINQENTKYFNFIIMIIFIGTFVWFNVKFLYLQYSGWFIYPYSSVH